MEYNIPHKKRLGADQKLISHKKRKKDREAVLDVLLKEIFYDRYVDANELNGLRLFAEIASLPKCCVLRVKKQAFRNYVNIHLNHPKVSDKQIALLNNIATKLGIQVKDIYDLADHPRRYCQILKRYKIKSSFRRKIFFNKETHNDF